jgi:VCBS repeat-containing protein
MTLSISDLFDESFYLFNNPDVAEAVRQGIFTSAFEHFIQSGQFELASNPGRNPHPLFDEAVYLARNPDVADAVRQGIFPNGFQHFIQFGQVELANIPSRSPSALFDEVFYLDNNPDVLSAVKAKSFASGYEHFVLFGQFETDTNGNRNPSRLYNEQFYLGHNSDVAAAVANGTFASGFQHYILAGQQEGRTAINTAPVAGNDSFTVNEDTLTVLPNFLVNDGDRDGDPLVIVGFTSPAYGSLTNNSNGTFSYTPNLNYEGTDSFTYTVSDGFGGVASSAVSITINPSPDIPVATSDAFALDEDDQLRFTSNQLLSNDFDPEGDPFFFDTFAQPTNGTVEGFGNGTFIYNPKSNFNGTDSFTYTITDGNGTTVAGTVNLTVRAINDPPIAGNDTFTTGEDTQVSFSRARLLANDTDVESNPILITSFTQPLNGRVVDLGGSYTYTPTANFNGTDSFTYTVIDGRDGTGSATVNITVTAINDAPVANPDTASTSEDTAVTINVLGNDTDIDGDGLVIRDFSTPTKGSLSQTNGSFLYTPNPNANGSDSFTYTISDTTGATASATVNVTISAVNDAPVANPDTASTSEDTAVTINVLGNDTDIEGNGLVITGASTPARGTVENRNGSFFYTPNANFNGSDSFVYTISDGNGGSASATVNITVTAVNDPPKALSDFLVVSAATSTSIFSATLLANDTDIDSSLTIASVTQPSRGSLTANSNGTYTYNSLNSFNGNDSFTYVVSDGAGGTASATVNLIVAQALDGGFSQSFNSNITNSETIPHASVNGTGDNNFDYYSFAAAAGSRGIFDIDFGDRGGTAALDTEIFLFDSNGNFLKDNDDATTVDPGSSSLKDSFLTHDFMSTGRYVIGVAKFDSTNTAGVGITGNPLTPNDSYTLHVSIGNPPLA